MREMARVPKDKELLYGGGFQRAVGAETVPANVLSLPQLPGVGQQVSAVPQGTATGLRPISFAPPTGAPTPQTSTQGAARVIPKPDALGLGGPISRTPTADPRQYTSSGLQVAFDPSVSAEDQAAFMRDPQRPATAAERGLTPVGFTRTTPDISSSFSEDMSIGGLVQRTTQTKQAQAIQGMDVERAELGLKAFGEAENRRILEERYGVLAPGEIARGEAAQMSVAGAKQAQALLDQINTEEDTTKRAALTAKYNKLVGTKEAKVHYGVTQDPSGLGETPYAMRVTEGGLQVLRPQVDYAKEIAALTGKLSEKSLNKVRKQFGKRTNVSEEEMLEALKKYKK